jgi:hypothetical protein
VVAPPDGSAAAEPVLAGSCICVTCKDPAWILAACGGAESTSAEKIYLWFCKQMLGQSIFMGSRKSITLTSSGRLHNLNEQANKRRALRTNSALATPAEISFCLSRREIEGDRHY